MSLPDLNLEEREQHVEIKNRIKESFELPQVQFPTNMKFQNEEIEKMKLLMEQE